jgi:flavin-dependent dehydrogenase
VADRELKPMRELEVSVAIVGAGPAGCAAALTLGRYLPELRVALIQPPQTGTPGVAVGETLSPGVAPLLGYLGLRESFALQGHLPAAGTSSAWGSDEVIARNYLFTGRGQGWHVQRERFDAWLLQQAAAAGVAVVHDRIADTTRHDGRWSCSLGSGGAVHAGAVIDATGRSAWVARREGADALRPDALTATARWYEHDEVQRSSEGALVEACADGWWYSATLPGQAAVAMFMTDVDLRGSAPWEGRLDAAPHTAARLRTWRERGVSATRAAGSQRSASVVGTGWVAAGDAAAAFDPLSSLGIGFALRSGMEAARVAVALGEAHTHPDAEADARAHAQAYEESMGRIWGDYRGRLDRVYQAEQRWPDSPFWARRHAR